MRLLKMRKIKQARAILKDKENVLVFTGSGASEPSGLPTFSGEEALVDWGIDRWLEDSEWRKEIWTLMFDTFWDIKPNAAHTAIDAYIWDGPGLHVTSNVDGLAMGLEVCGTAQRIRCNDCNRYSDKTEIQERWLGGDIDPLCTECVGTLRPDVVFIGETFDMDALIEYDLVVDMMDALVVVGASDLIGVWKPALWHAQDNDIPIISINIDDKPWGGIADVHLSGCAADIVPSLLKVE